MLTKHSDKIHKMRLPLAGKGSAAQIKDLEIPTILVINMADRMKSKGISLNITHLEEQLKTKIVLVSTRKGYGIDELKNQIVDYKSLSTEPCLNASSIDEEYFNELLSELLN